MRLSIKLQELKVDVEAYFKEETEKLAIKSKEIEFVS